MMCVCVSCLNGTGTCAHTLLLNMSIPESIKLIAYYNKKKYECITKPVEPMVCMPKEQADKVCMCSAKPVCPTNKPTSLLSRTFCGLELSNDRRQRNGYQHGGTRNYKKKEEYACRMHVSHVAEHSRRNAMWFFDVTVRVNHLDLCCTWYCMLHFYSNTN